MIGIGKWEATVTAMMFSTKGIIEIKDNNGKYEFIYNLPARYKNVKIKIHDISQIGNNTLRIKGEVSLFPGKIIVAQATFRENTLTGFIKAPVMGGITAQIRNGRKIG